MTGLYCAAGKTAVNMNIIARDEADGFCTGNRRDRAVTPRHVRRPGQIAGLHNISFIANDFTDETAPIQACAPRVAPVYGTRAFVWLMSRNGEPA